MAQGFHQADAYAQCKVDVQGGCKVDCEAHEGALFCQGQYVDHGDNLQECVDARRAYLDAHVEWEAEGSSSCANGSCMAEGKASASCSASPASMGAAPVGSAALLFGLSTLLRRRRRARARS